MNVLVLDTIHGGAELARALRSSGHTADEVDVYRGSSGITAVEAQARKYDCVAAPVHLDPDYPLLHMPETRVVSHHEAVRELVADHLPHPMIEITGARGKTTTAHALASLMSGPGILHTSTGTFRYPEKELLFKKSITPASVIAAADEAYRIGGWLIAEESLGVTGAGDVAVLTSGDDYPCAAGKKSALFEKLRLISRSPLAIVPDGVQAPGARSPADAVCCSGSTCTYDYNGIQGTFSHPLLELDGYRMPLSLAAATACAIGIDPAPLSGFAALPGRMATELVNGILELDNSNSGTNAATTLEAARYARRLSGKDEITLVIGLESQTVCEGFPESDIRRAIDAVRPKELILVGDTGITGGRSARTFEEAREMARSTARDGSIVLAVKTWR